jgi:hypothetical protein
MIIIFAPNHLYFSLQLNVIFLQIKQYQSCPPFQRWISHTHANVKGSIHLYICIYFLNMQRIARPGMLPVPSSFISKSWGKIFLLLRGQLHVGNGCAKVKMEWAKSQFEAQCILVWIRDLQKMLYVYQDCSEFHYMCGISVRLSQILTVLRKNTVRQKNKSTTDDWWLMHNKEWVFQVSWHELFHWSIRIKYLLQQAF